MATSFQTDAGGLWAEQAAGAALDYTLDWAESLDSGDTIAASDWAVDPGLLASQKSYTDDLTTVWLSGGLGGKSYAVTNSITTSTGRRDSKTFRLFVREGAGLGLNTPSVFGSLAAAVADLRRNRLSSVSRTWLGGVELSDEYLLSKLISAEHYVERRLRTFLTPREIVPHVTSQEERDALTDAGNIVEDDPGYDFDVLKFRTDAWGLIELRHRPIIEIHSIKFAYPSQTTPMFDVPKDWMRVDKKYGKIQFVPVYSTFGPNFSGWLMSMFAGGRSIPLAVQVRYRAGLQDATTRWPDLLNIISRLAVLDIINDQFLPTGGSSSVDGLSQTLNWNVNEHKDLIDSRLTTMAQGLQGIRLGIA